jgi:hypothetical protein
MTQVYRTLRVAPSDQGVLGVVIDAPPINLIGPRTGARPKLVITRSVCVGLGPGLVLSGAPQVTW